MNRTGLIVLQAIGALSILPYPFVLLANIMSMAAPGGTSATRVFWGLLCLYPLVWAILYFLSWRAMKRGATGLAFGLSSIPAAACAVVVGLYLFSWVGFSFGTAGIGPGGLHSTTYPDNPLGDLIAIAGQEVELPPGRAAIVERVLREIDARPSLVNASIAGHGSPLNVAVGNLSISLDGAFTGDKARQQDMVRIVRALVSHGAHFNGEEATDLRTTWHLRRALFDGPVTTAAENPLVWRIVTHNRGESKPFNPLTDKFPERSDAAPPFIIKAGEIPLLNTPTRLHGTPLYAALLDNAKDVCAVIIQAGGRLSAGEQRDLAASFALRTVLDDNPTLRTAYR